MLAPVMKCFDDTSIDLFLLWNRSHRLMVDALEANEIRYTLDEFQKARNLLTWWFSRQKSWLINLKIATAWPRRAR
jgi:hypothetical protein